MHSEKKEKRPAPGEYNITKTLKDAEAEKKKLASKKIHYQDRITYLDDIQYESNQRPGIGNYNPRVPQCSFRIESKLNTPNSSPNLKIGAKNMIWSSKRNYRRVLMQPHTALTPVTLLSLRTFPK